MSHMTEKLEADNISYAKNIFMQKDPKELFIAINELAYHLSQKSKNKLLACYWIEWILEFERTCHIKKNKCTAERRSFIPVAGKYQMEVVWIIWELLIRLSEEKGSSIKSVMNALLNLFCIRFIPSCKKKRKFILYFAVSLLTEYIDFTIKLYSDQSVIEKVKKKLILFINK